MAEKKILKQGYLVKSPPGGPSTFGKRWQKRWFILYEDGKLEYYVNEDKVSKEPPKGTIDMMDCDNVVDGQSKCSEPNSLGLETASRTYFLKGESKEIITEWKKALSAFIESPCPRSYTVASYPESEKPNKMQRYPKRASAFRKPREPLSSEWDEEDDVVLAQSELEHWKKECSDMKGKLKDLQGELERARTNSISSQHEERDRWDQTLEEKAKQVEELNLQMKEVKQTLKEKNREIEACWRKEEERSVLEESLRGEIDRLASSLTGLQNEQTKTKSKEEDWMIQEKKLLREVDTLKEKLSHLESEHGKDTPVHNGGSDKQITELERELKKASDSVVKLQVKRNRLETQFNDSQRDNRRLTEELSKVKEELGLTKSDSSQVLQLKAQVEELQLQVSTLQTERDSAIENVARLKAELSDVKDCSAQPRSPSTGRVVSPVGSTTPHNGMKDEDQDSAEQPKQAFTPIMYLFEDDTVKILPRTKLPFRNSHIPPVDRKYILEPWQQEHSQLNPITNVPDAPPKPDRPPQEVVDRLFSPVGFFRRLF